MAVKNSPSVVYKNAVNTNLAAWEKSMGIEMRKFISAVGGPTASAMVKTIFDDLNKQCKNCHPGAVSADGCACSGTTIVTFEPCSITAIEDTPAWTGLLIFNILGGTRVTLAGKRFIPAGATILHYGGDIFTHEQFLQLPPQQQVFGVQEKDSTSWVVPSGQKVGPRWTADRKYPGARIAFSKTVHYNCVVQQTADGSLVVMATCAIKGGDQLLYPRA